MAGSIAPGRRRRWQAAWTLCGAASLVVATLGAVPIATMPASAASPSVVLSSGWTYTDLGTLAGETSSHANDINDAGVVVGGSGDHAVRWVDGVPEQLASLPPFTEARAVNAAGRIVGAGSSDGTGASAYEFHPGADATPLGPGWADDINGSGVAVGTRSDGAGNQAWQFLPTAQSLAPVGAQSSNADAVDDAGTIYGSYVDPTPASHGVLLGPGGGAPISSDGRSVFPAGVSPGGLVAGRVVTSGVHTAPVLVEDGDVIDLPDTPQGWMPQDVNDDGLVVGATDWPNVRSSEAYLVDDGELIAVSNWLPDGFDWRIALLSGVNAHGQVVGVATDCPLHDGGDCTDHAIRLDPPGLGPTTTSSSSSTSSTSSTSSVAITSTTVRTGVLARTGKDPRPTTQIALALVGLGLLAAGTAERRRSQQRSTPRA